MPSQFFRLLQNEIAKAIRRKLPYFGIAAITVVCLISYFVAGRLSTAASANAWGYVAFSMQLVFTDIGPIFVIVFSAMQIAEETGSGTMRAALAAPVHRWELYLAKTVAALGYMLILSIAGLVVSSLFAKIHYNFSAVGDAYGVVYGQGKALRETLFSCVLSWIPLGALVMYGLFISTIIRNAGAAVAVGVSSVFLIDLTKHLVGLDPYVFTKYISYSWVTLQQLAQGMDYQWQPEVWRMIWLSGIYAVVAFGAGLTIFVRKDLNH